MFGENIVRKQTLGDGTSLDVIEIFPTIQGEGPFAGQPAIFIRLRGCNLRCYFCDTDFESNSTRMGINEILERIRVLKDSVETDLIVLTGGEPMLQNVLPLLAHLIPRNRVQIETAGTVWIDGLEDYFVVGMESMVTIVCSPKTTKVHKHIHRYCNDWKYVVSQDCESPDDGLPLISTQQKRKLAEIARPQFAGARIYLQPCDEQDEEKNTHNVQTAVRLSIKHGYRVCLQQHKLMGVE